MVILVLVVLGLALGSFANALVWRVYKQSKSSKKLASKYSITRGRSMCVDCGHKLSFLDLVPVISWVGLRGKCRYCHKKISWQYPGVELVTAVLFVLSYVFWPVGLAGKEWLAFGLWLAILTGFVALIVYDFRWMILPNKIILPLYFLAVIFVVVKLWASADIIKSLSELVLAVFIGGGIFYILFRVSKEKWIGGGDVKLGLLLGALALTPMNAMMLLFFASLLGCIYILPRMLSKKITKHTKIPFGPFLIIGCILVVLFGQVVSDWYFAHLIYR